MNYINKQGNNYKITNFNYLNKNNLIENDLINNLDSIIDKYMVKYIFNDIRDQNKFKLSNNNLIVLKEKNINYTKRNTLYNTKYNLNDKNIEILMFIYEKGSKNKLLFNYLSNLRLKNRFFRKRARDSDISLDLLIKHNNKSLFYINNNDSNNSNYSNLETYLNNLFEDYNITIKPIILKYPQMDNKIFNNFILFRQTKKANIT